jgi:hypothetical protein
VSGRSGWVLGTDSLYQSLDIWYRPGQTEPLTLQHFWDWVLDLMNDPLHRGKEDENRPGVFYGRVPGTNVGATFILDHERGVIYIVNISG